MLEEKDGWMVVKRYGWGDGKHRRNERGWQNGWCDRRHRRNGSEWTEWGHTVQVPAEQMLAVDGMARMARMGEMARRVV